MAGAPGGGSGDTNPIGPTGEVAQQLAEDILILAFPEFAPFIIVAFLIIQFVEELIGFLLDLFSGRPREQATIQVAQYLMKATNPAARHWGLCMIRALHQWDIVISESGSGSKIEGAAFHNFVQNMVLQGVDEQRARDIGVQSLSRDAQAGKLSYPIELQTPLPDGFFITGPRGLDDLYQKIYNKLIAKGLTPTDAQTEAQKRVFNDAPLKWVFLVQFTDKVPPSPKPGVPPTGGGGGGQGGVGGSGGGDNGGGGPGGGGNPPPPPPPTQSALAGCQPPAISTTNPLTGEPLPAGFGWDTTTDQPLAINDDGTLAAPPGYAFNPCTNATTPIFIPQQPVWPPPDPPPTPNPQAGTPPLDICCSMTALNLQYLASVIAALPLAPSATALVAPLEQLNSTVANIASTLARDSAPPQPIDFTPLVDALQKLWPKTREDPTGANGDWWNQADYSQAELDALVSIGALDPEVRAQLQGAIHVKVSPHFPAKKIAEYTAKFESFADKTADFIQNGIKKALGNIVAAFSDKIETDLELIGNSDPEAARSRFKSVMADAFEFGTTAHLISLGAEALAPLKHLGIAQLAEFAAEFAGFRELVGAYHRPILTASMMRPSTYHANKTFRPMQYSAGEALQFFARRLIDETDLEKYLGYAGFADALQPTQKTAAYEPLSPYLLVRELGIFNTDRAAIVAAMQFAGYRDADATLAINSQIQNGLTRVATPVIDQFVSAAADGLYSDADLTTELQNLNLTSDAIDLVVTRVRVQRYHKLATLYKSELDQAVRGGVIDLADYQSSLAAVGFQQTEIDVFSGIANIYLEKRTLEEQARLTAQQNRDVQRSLIQTAIQEYRRGDVIGAALTGALAAQGLTPAQVAAHVALETVRNEPTVKAGSTLSKFAQDQKTNATQRNAVIEAYARGNLPPEAARAQLAALGMPSAEITATLAYEFAKAQKKGTVTPLAP